MKIISFIKIDARFQTHRLTENKIYNFASKYPDMF